MVHKILNPSITRVVFRIMKTGRKKIRIQSFFQKIENEWTQDRDKSGASQTRKRQEEGEAMGGGGKVREW